MNIPKKQLVLGSLFESVYHCFVIVKLCFVEKLENLISKECFDGAIGINYKKYLNTFKHSKQKFLEKLLNQ